MSLPQLHQATQHLAAQAFCPGTSRNHLRQASVFIHFCDNAQCQFIHPSISTVCMFITHLTNCFQSSSSVKNYVSGIRVLHRELDLSLAALDSFQVHSLLRAADISMRIPLLRRLLILSDLLHCLCLLTSSLGPLGPSMRVCFMFGFLQCLGKVIWHLHPPLPSIHPGTAAGVTFFWHHPVCCFSSAGLRLIRQSASPLFCPYLQGQASRSLSRSPTIIPHHIS